MAKLKTINDYHREFWNLFHRNPFIYSDTPIDDLLKNLKNSGLIPNFNDTAFSVEKFDRFDLNLFQKIFKEFRKYSTPVDISKEMKWIEDFIEKKGKSEENHILFDGVYQIDPGFVCHFLRFFPDGNVILFRNNLPGKATGNLIVNEKYRIGSGKYKQDGDLIEITFYLEIEEGNPEIEEKLEMCGKIWKNRLLLNVFWPNVNLHNKWNLLFINIELSENMIYKSDKKEKFETGNEPHTSRLLKYYKEFLGENPILYTPKFEVRYPISFYFFAPDVQKGRNYYTVITLGFSNHQMVVPHGSEHLRYAELMFHLPMDWPGFDQSFKNGKIDLDTLADLYPKSVWPFKSLMEFTQYVFENNTFIAYNHTLGSPDPIDFVSLQAQFVYWVVINPNESLKGFERLIVGDKMINIYNLLPLYAEELNYKRLKGIDELLEKFQLSGINITVDPNRKNAIHRKESDYEEQETHFRSKREEYSWWIREATKHYHNKDFIVAAYFIEKALELEPENSDGLKILEETKFFLNNFRIAANLFNRVLDSNPNKTETYGLLGKTYDNLGDLEKYVFYYEKNIVEKPRYIVSLIDLIKTYKELESRTNLNGVNEYLGDRKDFIEDLNLKLEGILLKTDKPSELLIKQSEFYTSELNKISKLKDPKKIIDILGDVHAFLKKNFYSKEKLSVLSTYYELMKLKNEKLSILATFYNHFKKTQKSINKLKKTSYKIPIYIKTANILMVFSYMVKNKAIFDDILKIYSTLDNLNCEDREFGEISYFIAEFYARNKKYDQTFQYLEKSAHIFKRFKYFWHKAIQSYFLAGLNCKYSSKFSSKSDAYILAGIELFVGYAPFPVYSFFLSDMEDIKKFIYIEDWNNVVKKNFAIYEKILEILKLKKTWKFAELINKMEIKSNIEERLLLMKLFMLLNFEVIGQFGEQKDFILLNIEKFGKIKENVLEHYFVKYGKSKSLFQ